MTGLAFAAALVVLGVLAHDGFKRWLGRSIEGETAKRVTALEERAERLEADVRRHQTALSERVRR